MNALKRFWKGYSDLITLVWLERLYEKHPRLAAFVFGFPFSVLFGWMTWRELDLRVPHYEHRGLGEIPLWSRLLSGSILGTIFLLFAFFTLLFVCKGEGDIDVGATLERTKKVLCWPLRVLGVLPKKRKAS